MNVSPKLKLLVYQDIITGLTASTGYMDCFLISSVDIYNLEAEIKEMGCEWLGTTGKVASGLECLAESCWRPQDR